MSLFWSTGNFVLNEISLIIIFRVKHHAKVLNNDTLLLNKLLNIAQMWRRNT